jgi:hemerythrin-like domain-containing protein
VADRKELVDRVDVTTLLRFLRTFADDHHQGREESALFPELMRSVQTQEASVRHMLFEHDQERSLVGGLEDALMTKHGPEFAHFAGRLASLIRNHIYKEDRILFEIVDCSLTPEQDEKVTSELCKFELDPGVLKDLRRLESKYVRKVA